MSHETEFRNSDSVPQPVSICFSQSPFASARLGLAPFVSVSLGPSATVSVLVGLSLFVLLCLGLFRSASVCLKNVSPQGEAQVILPQ